MANEDGVCFEKKNLHSSYNKQDSSNTTRFFLSEYIVGSAQPVPKAQGGIKRTHFSCAPLACIWWLRLGDTSIVCSIFLKLGSICLYTLLYITCPQILLSSLLNLKWRMFVCIQEFEFQLECGFIENSSIKTKIVRS